ncbi:hypothetical protein [Kaistella sp.]|uniref:hypothetical protein n=1 Tax=Kaistella sp. TaxID=2782235 RepID=UPI002F9426B2
MTRLKVSYILLLFFIFSCSTEKINLSPIGENSVSLNGSTGSYTLGETKNVIVYSSEITSLISSFPKFRNDAVNSEVLILKSHLKDYIGAMTSYNLVGMEDSKIKFERSYKKLQKLRKFLNRDEDEVLNRYLVRIKTNMSFLNSTIPQDSVSTFKN